MSTIHDVEISAKIRRNKPYWKVKPGDLENVTAGDDYIRWKPIDSDVTLFFPEPNLFPELNGINFRTISANQTDKLKVGKVPKGEYSYAVFCHNERDFVEGGSSPIIIIER